MEWSNFGMREPVLPPLGALRGDTVTSHEDERRMPVVWPQIARAWAKRSSHPLGGNKKRTEDEVE
jgi:hypothetical protein